MLKLPLHLESELDFPGQSCQLGHIPYALVETVITGFVYTDNSGITVTAARLRGNEITVIEDIEHFGPELNVKLLRNASDREGFVN